MITPLPADVPVIKSETPLSEWSIFEKTVLPESRSAEKAAELILNTPTVSISITVLKPFNLIPSAVARKLPAAPFTTVSSPLH
jgi:hypothetical protein